MKILIVDDRPQDRQVLRSVLERAGYSVVEAADGVAALDILQQDPATDAIVSDVLLPRLDGHQLCREVRQRQHLCGIPFIFYTGTFTSPEDEQRALALGGDKYLHKPAPPETILSALHELDATRAARHPTTAPHMADAAPTQEYSSRLISELEEKIVQSRLEAIAMENAANAIVITDSKGHILRVNPAFTKLSGYEPEDVIGRTPRILKSGQHQQPFYRELWRTILSGTIWRGDFVNRRKDGTLYHGEQTIAPVRGPGGSITHFIGIMKDVTARNEAVAALKESEQRLREVVENIREVFWMADVATNQIVYVSPAYESIWGRSCESLRLAPQQWMDAIHPDDRDRVGETLTTALADGYDHEYRILRPDGVELWIRDRCFPVKDEHGVVCRLVGTAEDITERKKLEAQFLRAQRMESIGTLAGGIAHDLNNVLGPIVMSLDLLAMKFTDAESAEVLALIRASAQRGVDMVRQVLSFARGIEGRRMELQVKHLIRDIVRVVNDTFLKNIEVRTDLPRELWTLLADPTQLHQVLLNLCVNARDAMPTGGTLIFTAENLHLDAQYAALDRDARPGPYVVLKIEDTGTGIPPGIIEKIFDPFFTTKDVGRGTGLGLSTSLAIIKSHGGFIRVYSEVGKGTVFKIYLPARTEASDSTETTDARVAEMPRGSGELILVVDDESSVRLITQQTLEAFGYRTLLAADGTEAIAVYATRGTEIAVVLTDMMMPLMDGPATIQVLRKMNRDVRIIAASGLPTNNEVLSVSNLGIKRFLSKPFTADTLLKAIKEVIKQP